MGEERQNYSGGGGETAQRYSESSLSVASK